MKNYSIVTSDTMVTLETWETERGAPQVRTVPLPYANSASCSGMYYRTRITAENGEVIADSWD